MLSVSVTVDAKDARAFMVRITGRLENRAGLNKVLVHRLADELRDHFAVKARKPNKMAAPSTHFWEQVAASTGIGEITATGATATVADVRYRIQLFGGTVKPVNGGRFLTIPLIPEARGKRVSEYELRRGKKLFRPPFGRVLYERDENGDRTFIGAQKVTVRGNRANRGGYNSIAIRERSRVRPVYALKESVDIDKDPDAFPDTAKLLGALQEEADDYAEDLMERGTA